MDSKQRFPLWIFLGAVVLACGYLPTLKTPFDFTDDGNLVYPQTNLSFQEHVSLWWERVAANVEHLGPFRPVVWLHWQIAANTLGADPVLWRLSRLLWCALSAGMLLWLMRELRVHWVAALVAGAAAMWNPYRNDIWTSLTLAEGVAMPYALFAVVAARKAGLAERPRWWDVMAVLSLVIALGCKNVFIALTPAMLFLRLFPESLNFREGWHKNRGRAVWYLLPVAWPLLHFVYFKLNPQPHHYQTPGPSIEQAGRFLSWFKGAAGLDFLAVGLVVVCGWLLVQKRFRNLFASREARPLLGAACLLLVAGFVVYLPVNIMTGRYTMPAVWGFDLLFGLLLTGLIVGERRRVVDATQASVRALPFHMPRLGARIGWLAVFVGVVALLVANIGRQEKLTARSRMLWDALVEVEQTAPPDAVIGWVGSNRTDGTDLNTEEGIHFGWHLEHRKRKDLRLVLLNSEGQRVERIEVSKIEQEPTLRIVGAAQPVSAPWKTELTCRASYRFGKRVHECRVERADLPHE